MSVEQETLVAEGWEGSWEAGDRPEGYKETEERYKTFKKIGFSSTAVLGAEFATEYNSLITKARKEGTLSESEVTRIQESQEKLNAAMDTFKENL